ncbi:MAG: glycosyltransferase family 4 protein [Candidatus Ratteibacteria bacterium]
MVDEQSKILWLVSYFCIPTDSGAKLRVYSLLRLLSSRYSIALFGFYLPDKEKFPSSESLALCNNFAKETEIFENSFSGRAGKIGKAMCALWYRLPLQVLHFRKKSVLEAMNRVAEKGIDLVQAEGIYIGAYLFHLPDVVRVLVAHDVDSIVLWRSFLHHPGLIRKLYFFIQAIKMRFYEQAILPKLDLCIAVSEKDKVLLQKISRGKACIEVVPNGVDTHALQYLPKSGGKEILFVGNLFYHPNRFGIEWFLREIFPKILYNDSEVICSIVGKGADKVLSQYRNNRSIKIFGYAEKLEPLYEEARLSIVPLKVGGGTRLKILESMAFGRPVVSTSIGAEGLDVEEGKDLFIADSPDLFAEKTLAILKDDLLYESLRTRARRRVEESYDWSISAEKLHGIYKKVLQKKYSDRKGVVQ